MDLRCKKISNSRFDSMKAISLNLDLLHELTVERNTSTRHSVPAQIYFPKVTIEQNNVLELLREFDLIYVFQN